MPVSLNFTKHAATGAGAGTPLLMVHGLLGQGRNFGTLAKGFSAERDVYVVDMRNHGDSPWDERMDYPAMAEDLAAFGAQEIGTAPVVFGHSMGGKAAMRLALDRPEAVAGLIVADIAPVAYTHSHATEIDALRGLDLDVLTKRSEADAALKETVPDAMLRAFLLQNLRISGGEIARRSNLDVLAGAMGDLVGWTDEPGQTPYDGETLLVAGGASTYVQEKHEPMIRTLFPKARIMRIPDAGHWIHAEKPKEVQEIAENFLKER